MGKDADMLQNAGIIIEEPGFLRQWSGFHNLEFLYTIRNKLNKKYMYSVLEKVGLEPRSKIPVGKYSLGMRQRLAIGQAIMEAIIERILMCCVMKYMKWKMVY